MSTAPSKKHRLIAPLKTDHLDSEKKVKKLINELLDFHGWFGWMPPANGYGTVGIHDHNAIKNGVFMTVEAKYGNNKPTPMQCSFAAQITVNDGFSFCVNEKNIDHFAMWLESFEVATQHQVQGKDVPPEHGARMLNAISVLTDPFKLEKPKA